MEDISARLFEQFQILQENTEILSENINQMAEQERATQSLTNFYVRM